AERRQDDEDRQDHELEPEAPETGTALRVQVIALVLDGAPVDRHEREGYAMGRHGRRGAPARPARRPGPSPSSATLLSHGQPACPMPKKIRRNHGIARRVGLRMPRLLAPLVLVA